MVVFIKNEVKGVLIYLTDDLNPVKVSFNSKVHIAILLDQEGKQNDQLGLDTNSKSNYDIDTIKDLFGSKILDDNFKDDSKNSNLGLYENDSCETYSFNKGADKEEETSPDLLSDKQNEDHILRSLINKKGFRSVVQEVARTSGKCCHISEKVVIKRGNKLKENDALTKNILLAVPSTSTGTSKQGTSPKESNNSNTDLKEAQTHSPLKDEFKSKSKIKKQIQKKKLENNEHKGQLEFGKQIVIDPNCNVTNTESELLVNIKSKRLKKTIGVKRVECEYCKVSFENQRAYFEHRKAEESLHTCTLCGKTEPFKAHLLVHMIKRHPRNNKAENVKDDSDGISSIGTDIKLLSKPGELNDIDRQDCNDILTSDTDQRHANSNEPEHQADYDNESCMNEQNKQTLEPEVMSATNLTKAVSRKKEKVQCSVCACLFSSVDALRIHMMIHTNEMAYKCCVCAKMFSCLSSRQHHMTTHMKEFPFNCILCSKGFTTRGDLALHQVTHNQQCPLCSVSFPNKTSLNCHFRVAHDPEDMLKCLDCSKMFATEAELDRHQLYHRNYKREQCPECGAFVMKLKDHMVVHNKDRKDKLFACDECPAKYLRLCNLKRHKLSHTGARPYACSHCPKTFATNALLHRHLLIHTQEKPHQCEVCGKSFALRSNMLTHKRIHSSRERFSCGQCAQEFNHNSSLQKHLKSKHKTIISTSVFSAKTQYTKNDSLNGVEHYTDAVPPQMQVHPFLFQQQPSVSYNFSSIERHTAPNVTHVLENHKVLEYPVQLSNTMALQLNTYDRLNSNTEPEISVYEYDRIQVASKLPTELNSSESVDQDISFHDYDNVQLASKSSRFQYSQPFNPSVPCDNLEQYPNLVQNPNPVVVTCSSNSLTVPSETMLPTQIEKE